MNNSRIKANAALLGTAIIWGGAFVVQRNGMDSLGPFMFSSIRMFLGALALIPVIIVTDARNRKSPEPVELDRKKDVIIGGTVAGVVYFIAANLQQVGLVSVDAGKTAFITALYILLVPIIGVFLKHKITKLNWIGAIIGVAGLYFLCIKNGFTIARGDFTVLVGSLFWAFHILTIDHFTDRVTSAKLIAAQSVVAGILSLIVALVTETSTWDGVAAAIPNLLYSGVLSAGVAFTLQAAGQKHANATTASIILSTESLFGAICGFLFLHEVMTGRELFGCALMLAAIVISQLPSGDRKNA